MDHPSQLKLDLQALFRSPELVEFADACFVVHEHTFWVHKAIMVARNQVFAQMFSSRMQEATSRTVHLSDVSVVAFDRLLEYLYCGSHGLEDLSFEEGIQLLSLSDRFLLSGLKEFCGVRIREALDASNALKVLAVADQTAMVGLKIDSLSMISAHFYSLASNPDLYDMSPDLLVQIIHSHCSQCPTFRYLSADAQLRTTAPRRPRSPRHGGSLINLGNSSQLVPLEDPSSAPEFEPNEADIMVDGETAPEFPAIPSSPLHGYGSHHLVHLDPKPAPSTPTLIPMSTVSSSSSSQSLSPTNSANHLPMPSSSPSLSSPSFTASSSAVPSFRSRSDTLRNCLTIHFPEYQQFQGAFLRYEANTIIKDILEKVTKKRNMVASEHQVRIFRPEGGGSLSPPSSPPLYPNLLLSLDTKVADIGSTDLYVVKRDGEYTRGN